MSVSVTGALSLDVEKFHREKPERERERKKEAAIKMFVAPNGPRNSTRCRHLNHKASRFVVENPLQR